MGRRGCAEALTSSDYVGPHVRRAVSKRPISYPACTLTPIILKTYGLGWKELKVQEAPIEIHRSGDIVEAKLADGQQAYVKFQREPGVDRKGVVLKNVKYFDAVQNDGFQLYKSVEHRVDLNGRQFSYSDRKWVPHHHRVPRRKGTIGTDSSIAGRQRRLHSGSFVVGMVFLTW